MCLPKARHFLRCAVVAGGVEWTHVRTARSNDTCGLGGNMVTGNVQLPVPKRVVMLAVPLLLGALEIFHPASSNYEGWVQTLDSVRVWWLILHIVQLPLFALLGLSVLWML